MEQSIRIQYGMQIKCMPKSSLGKKQLRNEITYAASQEDVVANYKKLRLRSSLFYYDITLFRKAETKEIFERYSTFPDS